MLNTQGCYSGGKGEDKLIEHHMARDEDPTRGEVVAAVPLVVWGVSEEDREWTGEPACAE
jgi:hypothetical protein